MSNSTPKRSLPPVPDAGGAEGTPDHDAVIRRTRSRRQRIQDAPDEPTRRRWIREATQRRTERIERATARQRARKAAQRERRRVAVARQHLPEDQVHRWERPANRAVLDRVLTDARERRLFGLPPRPEVEIGGIRRISRSLPQ